MDNNKSEERDGKMRESNSKHNTYRYTEGVGMFLCRTYFQSDHAAAISLFDMGWATKN